MLGLFWVIKQEVLLGVMRMHFDSSRARVNLCLMKCVFMFRVALLLQHSFSLLCL